MWETQSTKRRRRAPREQRDTRGGRRDSGVSSALLARSCKSSRRRAQLTEGSVRVNLRGTHRQGQNFYPLTPTYRWLLRRDSTGWCCLSPTLLLLDVAPARALRYAALLPQMSMRGRARLGACTHELERFTSLQKRKTQARMLTHRRLITLPVCACSVQEL